MPTTRATKEIAQSLGVSVSTMRNWSDQYAAFLSETARPGHLPERRFADRDLTILTYIKQLRSEGMQADQIKERLGEITFNDVEVIAQQAITGDNTRDQISAIETSQATPESHQNSSGVIMVVLDAMNIMQQRVDALEQAKINDRRLVRDSVFMFMAGSVVTLVLMLIVIVVVDLWAK